MKGMDIMAAKGVALFGAEQANGFQAPSVASDGQGMSFAENFGEIAAGAVRTTFACQILKGNTSSLAAGPDASAGSMEKLLNSVGGGLKQMSAPASPVSAKSIVVGVAGAQVVPAQSSEEPGDVPLTASVADGNTTALQSAEIGASVGATPVTPVSSEEPDGSIVDTAEDLEVVEAKIDSSPLPLASKMPQPLLAGDGDQLVVQKKEGASVLTGKPVEVKTTKKELKNPSIGGANSTNVSTPGEVLSTQVVMTVPTGAPPLVVTKPQTVGAAAEGNSNAASGQVVAIAGAKATKSSTYGVKSGVAGTSVSSAANDGAVSVGKADAEVAGMKKDEADSSKVATSVVPAKGLNEGTAHGPGVAAAVSAAHGGIAVTGNIAGDIVAAKASAPSSSFVMTTGQSGTNQSAANVSEDHRTLEATPTSLEVGVANGTQGWLKIRAELADGVVNASVSATTSAGQEMLHRELPSLTAYLQQEQIAVGSVVLHTAATAGSQGFAGGMEREAEREQMQQRGGQEGASKQDTNGKTISDSEEAYVQGGLSGIAEIATNTVYAGGSWLSVRA